MDLGLIASILYRVIWWDICALFCAASSSLVYGLRFVDLLDFVWVWALCADDSQTVHHTLRSTTLCSKRLALSFPSSRSNVISGLCAGYLSMEPKGAHFVLITLTRCIIALISYTYVQHPRRPATWYHAWWARPQTRRQSRLHWSQ